MAILQTRSRLVLLSMGMASLFWVTPVFSQVVMLPTQRIFSVSTSVSVPDRGMAHLGSISRAREGSVTRGVPGLAQLPMAGRLFRNQGIGRDMENVGAAVTATIIDLQELDKQVLASARVPVRSPEELQVARKADFLMRNLGRQTNQRSLTVSQPRFPITNRSSVAEIRRANHLAAVQRQQEAEEYLQHARQLEDAGRTGGARIYYQMAARRTSGLQQRKILDRLQQINVQRAVKIAQQPRR